MSEKQPRFSRNSSQLEKVAHYMRRMQDQVENSYVLEKSQRRLGRLAASRSGREAITKPTGNEAEA